MTSDTAPAPPPSWKAVAVPSEHGGWSLTAEPALLGLLVVFSGSGLAIAVAAMLSFVARTPLKVVLVDRWRGRWLPRTSLAARIAAVELLVIGALFTVAAVTAEGRWWLPLLIALPLIVVELWYDMRSRSRRLIPELAGSIGIGSVAAAVGLAGGEAGLASVGLWAVIAARNVAAVPYVRHQIMRLHGRPAPVWNSDVAQLAAVAGGAVGWAVDAVPLAAVVALTVLAIVDVVAVRQPGRPAKVIGFQQMFYGLAVIVVTAIGVRAR